MLRFMFVFGAIADGAVALTWILIAAGFEIPNILNGYVGSGSDYQLAMYLGALLMAGWASLLAWGAIRPIERRGLLLITAVLLMLSVITELLFFRDILEGIGFVFGITRRTLLGLIAAAIYFYSLRKDA